MIEPWALSYHITLRLLNSNPRTTNSTMPMPTKVPSLTMKGTTPHPVRQRWPKAWVGK